MNFSIPKTLVCIFIFIGYFLFDSFSSGPHESKVADVDTLYFNTLVSKGTATTMNKKDLLAEKELPLPENFIDTLKKYDWYEVEVYTFNDKILDTEFSPPLDTHHCQCSLRRFDEDGTMNDMYFFKNRLGPEMAIFKTTFDNGYFRKLTAVQLIKGSNYEVLENQKGIGYQKIVSYKNGVLIEDISRDGKVNSKYRSFRITYVAMKKV
jgi:hypothetical protein